jgi:hypothetical protein
MPYVSEARSVSIFRKRSAQPGGPLTLGTLETAACKDMHLRPDLTQRKMAIEKLKINYKA